MLGVYTAVLALALLPMVALSRRVGGAAVAAGGIAVFGLASLACGLGGARWPAAGAARRSRPWAGRRTLIGAFALLDAGQEGPGRRLWFTASIFGAAIGPALGGALTEAFDWRAIFLAQVPLVVPGLLVAGRRGARRALRASARRRRRAPTPRCAPRPAVALALLSAALTAVIFLVVLLLVAGWSVDPLAAALAVSVLPVAAVAASRIPGDPDTRARCRLPAGRRRRRLPGAAAGRLGLVDRAAAAAGRRGHGAGAAGAGGRAAARAHPPRRRRGCSRSATRASPSPWP